MLRVSEVPRKAAGALRGVSCMLRYEKGLERSVSCCNRKPEACLYPSFLVLMQEKKQKKIKASGIIRQSKSTRFPIKKYKNGACFSRPVFCIPFTPRKGAFSPPFGRLLYFLEGRRVDQIEHDDLIAACLHCGTAAAEGGNRIAQRLTLEGIV